MIVHGHACTLRRLLPANHLRPAASRDSHELLAYLKYPGIFPSERHYHYIETEGASVNRSSRPERAGWRRRVTTGALAVVATTALATGPILVPEQSASQMLPQAAAAPCPDGSQTCAPQPTQGGGPTQGNQIPTTAPQAPQTTIPGQAPDTGLQAPTQGGNTPTAQGNVPTIPTITTNPSDCIVNCTTSTPAPESPRATTQQPSASSVPESDHEDIVKKCIQAAAQLGTPAVSLNGGGGRDPGVPWSFCGDCVDRKVDSNLSRLAQQCQRIGPARYAGTEYIPVPGTEFRKLTGKITTNESSVTLTKVGTQLTAKMGSEVSLKATVGGSIPGFAKAEGEAGAKVSSEIGVLGPRLDTSETLKNTTTINPIELYRSFPDANYSTFDVGWGAEVYSWEASVSCPKLGDQITVIRGKMTNSLGLMVFPPRGSPYPVRILGTV